MRVHIRRFLLLTLFLISGCTTSVVVEGTIPSPLVSKMPLRLGVYYPDGFKSYHHKEDLKEHGAWGINMGQQNVKFFVICLTQCLIRL